MAIDQTIGMQINAQFSNATSAIDSVVSKLNSLSTAIGTVSSRTSSLKTLQNTLSKISGLNFSSLSGAASNIATLANALRDLTTSINALGDGSKRISSLATSLNRLGKVDVMSVTNTVRSLTNAVVESSQAMASTDTSGLQNLVAQYTQLAEAVTRYNAELRKANQASGSGKLKNVATQLTQTTKAAKTSATSLTGFTKQLMHALSFGKMYAWYNQLRHYATLIKGIMTKPIEFAETENYFSVAFGEMRAEAWKFGNDLADAFGLALPTIMKMQATFKNMISSIGGLAAETSTEISEIVTKMTIDYASLYNIGIEDASKKFQSALSRQVRPIRSTSGYDITNNVLEGTAQAIGINDRTISQMSEMEKRLLVLITLQQQMARSGALQDFARTIESPANQLKILTEQLSEAGRAFGSMFTASISSALPYINGFVMALKELLMNIAFFFGYEIPETVGATGTVLDSYDDTLTDVSSGLEDVGEETDKNYEKAKKWKNFLAGFDVAEVIPTPTEYEGSSSGTTSGDVGATYVDDRILASLKNYDNLMYSINMKANGIKESIQGTFGAIGDWVSVNIFEPILTSWGLYGQPVVDDIEEIKGNLEPIFSEIATDISENFGSIVQTLSSAFFGIVGTVSGVASNVSYFLKGMWDGGGKYLYQGITDLISSIIGFGASVLNNFVNPLLDGLKPISESIGRILGAAAGVIGGLLSAFADLLDMLSENRIAVTLLGSAFSGIALTAGIGAFITTPINLFGQLLGVLKKIPEMTAFKFITAGIGTVNDALAGSGIVKAIGGFGDKLSTAGTAAGGLGGTIKTVLGGALSWLAAHPAVAVATAIGGLIAAFALTGSKADDATYELEDFSEEVQDQIEKVEDLDGTLSGLASSYESSFADAQAEAMTLEKCLDDLVKADADGIVDEDEMAGVKAAVDLLNDSLGTTVATIKDGKIVWEEDEEAIKNRITALKEAAIEEAKIQLYTDYIKERTKAEIEGNNIRDKIIEKQSEIARLEDLRAKAQSEGDWSAMYDYIDQIEQAEADLYGLEEAQKTCTEKVDEMDKSIESLDSKMEGTTSTVSVLSDDLRKLYDDMKVDNATINSIETTVDGYKNLEDAIADAKEKGEELSDQQIQDIKDNNKDIVEKLGELAGEYGYSYGEIEALLEAHGIAMTDEEKRYYKEAVKRAGKAYEDIEGEMNNDITIGVDIQGETSQAASAKKKIQETLGKIVAKMEFDSEHLRKAFENFFKNNVFEIQGNGNGVNMRVNKVAGNGYVSTYATGGFPNVGEMFIARESGPEMVGTIGGHNAVANNSDIVSAVSQGVYNAVKAANGNGGDLYLTIQNSDGTKITKIIKDYNRYMAQNGGRGGFNI